MNEPSTSFVPLATNEKKLRFRPQAKVLFSNESQVEDLFKTDKNDKTDEVDSPKKCNNLL